MLKTEHFLGRLPFCLWQQRHRVLRYNSPPAAVRFSLRPLARQYHEKMKRMTLFF